jgi:hypothetical protein
MSTPPPVSSIPETGPSGEAPVVERPYEVRAEMKIRHSELKSISERLDHVANTSRAKKWEVSAEVAFGAFGAGVLGLVPFLVSKPSLVLLIGYLMLLAGAGIFGLICWNAGRDVADERVDSVLAIKQHIDSTMLRTETPRLQAPTTARRVAPPAAQLPPDDQPPLPR